MQDFDIVRETVPSESFRVASVIGKYDWLGRVSEFGSDKKFKRSSRGRLTASFKYIPNDK